MRNWLFSEPVQHTAVTTVYLNAMDLIHSVAKSSSEVQGYMTWKTSDHWGVGCICEANFESLFLTF